MGGIYSQLERFGENKTKHWLHRFGAVSYYQLALLDDFFHEHYVWGKTYLQNTDFSLISVEELRYFKELCIE